MTEINRPQPNYLKAIANNTAIVAGMLVAYAVTAVTYGIGIAFEGEPQDCAIFAVLFGAVAGLMAAQKA